MMKTQVHQATVEVAELDNGKTYSLTTVVYEGLPIWTFTHEPDTTEEMGEILAQGIGSMTIQQLVEEAERN